MRRTIAATILAATAALTAAAALGTSTGATLADGTAGTNGLIGCCKG
jgi:Spy/CpxP family protein refolding chaperone